MQQLFRIENDMDLGTFYLRQWSYTKDGLEQNLSKIIDFYHDYPVPCASSHLLVRLIQSMGVSRQMDYDRYVSNCTRYATATAQALKLTTATSKGDLWNGVFYGGGSTEIILGHSTYFDVFHARNNWKMLEPVVVLSHSQTNLALIGPDSKTTSDDKGVNVIAINIPMLMAMYYCFNVEQDQIEASGGVRKNINQFVGGFIMTNAVRSHTDQVVFNRLFDSMQGLPSLKAFRKHSFYQINYAQSLDTVINQQLQLLPSFNRKFAGVMRATPMVSVDNLQELSRLPAMAPTYQCLWALSVARIKMLAFLMLTQKNAEIRNASEINQIQRTLKFQNTRKAIKNNLSLDAYYLVSNYLDIVGAA
jgi:hypothetical protein